MNNSRKNSLQIKTVEHVKEVRKFPGELVILPSDASEDMLSVSLQQGDSGGRLTVMLGKKALSYILTAQQCADLCVGLVKISKP